LALLFGLPKDQPALFILDIFRRASLLTGNVSRPAAVVCC